MDAEHTKRSEVFTAYQRDAKKKDRLRGTWTLGEYERSYRRYFAYSVMKDDPEWMPGAEFDSESLIDIERVDVERLMVSNGVSFSLDVK